MGVRKCLVIDCDGIYNSKGYCRNHYYKFNKWGNPFYVHNREKKLNFAIDSNGCFVVDSHKPSGTGYIPVTHNGRQENAHRKVYIEMFGDISDSLHVRHSCDNKVCINPEHLLLGTHQDNMDDKTERDRNSKGSLNGNSKLTEKEVLEMRNNKENLSNIELGEKYNVTNVCAWNIMTRRTWKHL